MKKPKKFYLYPKMDEEIKKTCKDMNLDMTELIEASIAFFLKCPHDYQDRIFRHYYRSVKDWICEDDDSIERLVEDDPLKEGKNNNGKEF